MTVPQTYEITPELVDSFLARFGKNEVVADRCKARSCPIAKAMADAFGVNEVAATPTTIVGRNRESFWNSTQIFSLSTPEWAKRFMDRVDNSRGGIRAGTARRYLAEVLQEDRGSN